jgi:hypothetical protein
MQTALGPHRRRILPPASAAGRLRTPCRPLRWCDLGSQLQAPRPADHDAIEIEHGDAIDQDTKDLSRRAIQDVRPKAVAARRPAENLLCIYGFVVLL